jgi:hypothetical protein
MSALGDVMWAVLVKNMYRYVCVCVYMQRWARATFFESAIAIPQLEGSTSAIAIPQLFKKCFSATATPLFRNCNVFLSPQLESFTSAIFGIFWAVE